MGKRELNDLFRLVCLKVKVKVERQRDGELNDRGQLMITERHCIHNEKAEDEVGACAGVLVLEGGHATSGYKSE